MLLWPLPAPEEAEEEVDVEPSCHLLYDVSWLGLSALLLQVYKIFATEY